ncbi:hypothetical protein GVN20_26890 [Runella sp. CRIBMP]|uniref:DUF4198 domain-containing protein n=1 Tax=Runella sp. CRIBMP TaxID=2683261 RepID=UPI001412FED1|nr:DUF4198 domain-containing protein [Runella sp. CRIBMP]NBB23011.1 hypothetical protein [Runella sp. CRIBMP]
MIDVSLLNNGKKIHPAESSWTEENSQTVLRYNTGQMGDKLTSDYKAALGYPVEFVPLSNPYSAKAGGELSLRLLKKSKLLANELGSYLGRS